MMNQAVGRMTASVRRLDQATGRFLDSDHSIGPAAPGVLTVLDLASPLDTEFAGRRLVYSALSDVFKRRGDRFAGSLSNDLNLQEIA